jgi:colanic acid/amylovoran biosynthesis glycosyltransferase
VLQAGIPALLWAMLRTLLLAPRSFCRALALAVRMGRDAERSMPYHVAYLAEACRMLPWLKAFGACHVHAHFGTNSAEVAMLVRALGGPPYSFTIHGPREFDRPAYLGLGEKMRRAAFVVAITSYGSSQLFRWLEYAHWAKVKVIHCGLDAALFDKRQAPISAAPRLVFVGRLVEQKGPLLLIEAAARLEAKQVDFQLVLVGEGEMRGEIEQLIARHGLGKHVSLTGPVTAERLQQEIADSRALVLPSFAEGLPMVLMEAMALRRPVLTTYVAGIPELVRHGKDGWLFPAGSIDALADAMEACLALSQDQLHAMGEAAYQRVRERHSIDREVSKLAELFKQSCAFNIGQQ